MNFSKLSKAICKGERPIVTFTEGIADTEGYAECGMKARIISAKKTA